VEYRGYGHSDGTPDEAGLGLDAEAILNFALEHEEINNEKIFVFGRSLGGAVSIELCSKFPEKVKRKSNLL
jgi:pimeloyl-ACP methyl ester carboxylesterase